MGETLPPYDLAPLMIHYHGLPITPLAAMTRAMKGRHAMVSFAHASQIEVAAEICQSVALDNGAYSAWRSKRRFDFKGYQHWAAEWLKHPAVDWVIIPDIIDGTEAQNDALLDRWPLPQCFSVPVFHVHESPERLDRLVSAFPRVALGSSGAFAKPGLPTWWKRIAQLMTIACDGAGRPRCKLHGLRMLDSTVFSHLPLSSADSCNVARNIGIDKAWEGRYTPHSEYIRALVLIDRIEAHASARRWVVGCSGVQQNFELIG